jgi:hypothetical protein
MEDDGSAGWSVNMLFEQSADLFLLVNTRGTVLHAAPSIADILVCATSVPCGQTIA